MNHTYRIYSLFIAFVISCFGAFAQDDAPSPSKQINNIIRSGEYVYAEATADSEEEAIQSCQELIKVEISKYIAEISGAAEQKQRVIRTLDYDTRTITVPRTTKMRVFMYVSKAEIEQRLGEGESNVSSSTPSTTPYVPDYSGSTSSRTSTPSVSETPSYSDSSVDTPSQNSNPAASAAESASATVRRINIEKNELPQWQIDALKNIIAQGSMAKVKNRLNSYKAQYKVKRLGDDTTRSPKPLTTFYVIFDGGGNVMALLAPSDSYTHYDYISGSTVDMSDYRGNKHLWFEFSK